MSLQLSAGTSERLERLNEPSENRDAPSLAVSYPETTGQRGQSRRTELPTGDSVVLRVARRFGLR